MDKLITRLAALGAPKVALVGDFVLDRYVYGDVERINPEAPVPVLRIVKQTANAGGAGNVAAAVPALGAQVRCAGVIGNDAPATDLRSLLAAAGADTSGLVTCDDRPTAVKTRFVGLAQHRHPQQMLRVDDESTLPLDHAAGKRLRDAFAAMLAWADTVVLEDYNKGVLSDAATPELIQLARRAGKPVVVDPALLRDYSRYRGATVIKPNRYEAAHASGVSITDDATLAQAARHIVRVTQAQAVVISLDREGAYLFQNDQGIRVPHLCPRQVYDVTGAGDETLAVLAVALAGGCSLEEAVALANVAGGLEVERFGFAPIRRDELVCELHRMMGLRGNKVLPRAELAVEIDRRRRQGQTVVFTNGCFDLLHLGHVRYLQQARELGHCLIVAINSDASVRRLKGQSRPVIGQDERAGMLASLECVDYVTVFDEDTPIPLLDLLRPHLLVKGGTTPSIVGRELVEGYGGRVLTLDMVEGLSTSQIIQRIQGNA
jgi:D-beta-D-heptose 7-phosphate kinase/D-beta-D-heptose 1-phosphate adenosyltransferase